MTPHLKGPKDTFATTFWIWTHKFRFEFITRRTLILSCLHPRYHSTSFVTSCESRSLVPLNVMGKTNFISRHHHHRTPLPNASGMLFGRKNKQVFHTFLLLRMRFVLCSRDPGVLRAHRIMGFSSIANESTRSENPITKILCKYGGC